MNHQLRRKVGDCEYNQPNGSVEGDARRKGRISLCTMSSISRKQNESGLEVEPKVWPFLNMGVCHAEHGVGAADAI